MATTQVEFGEIETSPEPKHDVNDMSIQVATVNGSGSQTSNRGYIARRKEIDFLVAMNPETAEEDVRGLEPGAAVIYDEKLAVNRFRSDLILYPVPFDQIVAPVCPEAKLRKLVRNMIYVGVVAKLLGVDMKEVEKALRKQFKKKV